MPETRQHWSFAEAAVILLGRYPRDQILGMTPVQRLQALNIAVNHRLKGLVDEHEDIADEVIAQLLEIEPS